jgi:glycosyltransferase involved in cell wall biosynthesis
LIWSLDLGGAERVVMDLAKGLSKKVFKPKVCCLNAKGRYATLLERHGIRVFALNKWPKFDPFLIPRLVRLIKRERIDLVHTHLFSANLWGRLAAKWAKVPVVSTEHGMDTWRKGFHLTLDSLLVPVSKRVIFVSEAVKAFYKSKNISFKGKGRDIYNGINTPDFEKKSDASSIRSGLGLKETEKVIGIIGRLVPEKAHGDFIRAIQLVSQKHPNAVGLIVGDGELLESLKKEVKKAGLENRIIFTGQRNDLPEIYRALDVFVLSSTREGFPLVVLEAMAARVPIVATAVGGVGELITDQETGLLVNSQNPEALAKAISNVLESSDLGERLAKNAYEKVKAQFSVEQMVKNHELLYREVLASC